ncbi:MAG: phosphatidate cytidylyltransferase [Alphaproteobacteria bacterium]
MGRFNLKALQKRALSAFILIPAVLCVVAWGGLPFYLMIALFTGVSLHEWFLMARRTENAVFHSVWGFLYLLAGFVFCVFIRSDLGFGPGALFLFMVWGADIGAYFTGKYFGGPKMAPSVSPNKTWAGLIGACNFAGVAGVLYFSFNLLVSSELVFSWWMVAPVFVLGVLIALAGQGGDLVVSAMKRKAGVKDTGRIIPGHGGLLDRIDSMLLAAPVFYVLFSIFSIDL